MSSTRHQTVLITVGPDGFVQNHSTGPRQWEMGPIEIMEQIISDDLSETEEADIQFHFPENEYGEMSLEEARAEFLERTGLQAFWERTTWTKDDTWAGKSRYEGQSPQLNQGYVMAVNKETHNQLLEISNPGSDISDEDLLNMAERMAQNVLGDHTFTFGDLGSASCWTVEEALAKALPNYHVKVHTFHYFAALL